MRDLHLSRRGTIRLKGRSLSVTVRDLSLGGAMIDETLPDAPLDTPMTLVIDGIPSDLAGFVARHDAGATLVRFELSAQAGEVVGRLVAPRQAA